MKTIRLGPVILIRTTARDGVWLLVQLGNRTHVVAHTN